VQHHRRDEEADSFLEGAPVAVLRYRLVTILRGPLFHRGPDVIAGLEGD